ncbi:Piwi-domain-containing protein [Cucurbitaria berberidis CBS 394.84]|uniref:Piwi-domain-containing protein n=1 Tax=Cucurbitaria berberidis CBS 394.84 TaxID=1168544 RepID=A0A9P4GPC5_9PLEO|nr:Piwi-domain-containing protein [Cucurbitaria berberidis CBS 394.84]KAF1849347.1 Piwi-domain-containing protein [Cucurbitaria berberidis CBS 394.84]
MANPEPVPKSNPIPGNRIDSQSLDKALSGPRIPGLQAEFPLRKAFYNSNTTVYTNHFAIKLDPNMPLYEYEIKGLPGKLGKKTAKILVREMINKLDFLRNHQDEFATDHCKTLVSWVNLPDTTLAPVSVSSEEGKELVILQLQRKGEVNTALLKQYAEGKAQPNKAVNDKILSVNEALNMVISKALSRDSFSLKANKFFVTGGHTRLGDSLCTMRGYFYSIKPGMGQILLNLNACTSAFYQPVLVSKFLLDNNTIRDQEERLSVLRGLRVHLTYDPKHSGVEARSRAATIEAYMKTIEETGLPCLRQTFNHKGRDGKPDEKPTVQQYFQKTYKKTLQYPQLPAINCGTKLKPLWYPAEVLQILPYQIYKRKVPDGLTKDMLDIACHPPKDTRALIEHEGLRKLGLSSSPGFARFSACPPIMIDSRMLQIPAAILPYPTPNYGNGIVNWSNPRDARDSKWNLMGRKFLQASAQTPFKVFMVVVPRDGGRSKLQSQPAVLQQVWKGFSTAAQHTYATGKFTYVGDTTCPPFAQPQIAQKVMAMAKDKGANLVLLLLEAKSTTAYSIFKDLADRTYDMHSLCAVYKEDRTGRPFGDQYWGNVMMKINLKAGGVNHTVTKVAEIMKDTLVLGADVTHPGPGSLQGTPSIAAIVGSVDQLGGKFLGSMRLQPRDTACEDIKDVEDMVLERIKAWVSVNKTLPKNILYYRDGVSSSQYSQVRENELPQIRKAFAAAAKQANMMIVPKFKLTAIVVAKRHHVRFLPPSNDAKDAMSKNGNCKPGTLVDTVVTSPYFQDFYLQSHDGLKGTAKPAHYFVLENEMGKTEKELQEFTHQLCYTYVRATMGVSYAPPAYYADRLCERGRCYLRPFLAPSQDFANRHKKMRFNVEQEIKAERETKFRGERTTDSMGMVVKSAEEKKQEETDRDRAEMVVKRNTFESAKATFYGSDIVRNPWKDAIGKTMFWM